MTTFLSIIIPIYNVENYLSRCIESILSQDFKDWELILINDGSTDFSKQIAENYEKSDSRIHLINTQNYGVSHARNLGLDAAIGKYIYFVDSDDELEINALSTFKSIEALHSVSLYKFGYCRINNNEEFRVSSLKTGIFDISQGLLLLEKNMYSGFLWNTIFRSDLIKKHNIRFDETVSWCEDHLFFLEYLNLSQDIYIDKSICYKYYIRNNVDSLSSLKRSPFIYIEIGKREFNLKEKCNKIKLEELIKINHKGFNEKCIIAVRSAISQYWNFKSLFLLYKEIRNCSYFTNNIYFMKNKLVFFFYCLAKKIK